MGCSWHHTSSAIVLCEYYLRTKDKKVLPAIQDLYKILAAGQHAYYGTGHSCRGGDYRGSGFNVTGAHTLLSFGLMKKCGIKMDADRVKKTHQFLLSATDRGVLAYGGLGTIKKGGGNLNYRYDGSSAGSGARNGLTALGARLLGNLKESPDYSDELIKSIMHRKGDPQTRLSGLAFQHGCKIMSLLWGGVAVAAHEKAGFSEIMRKHIWHLQLARVPGEGWIKEHPQKNIAVQGSVKPSALWNATYALLLNAKKQNLYITGKGWKK
ncbi:MAG: hypothetical protein HRT88_20855 [Lentisphaeraceae bacterium]|nr:hypothetical protein [Lentisphaeraceae bacterium]